MNQSSYQLSDIRPATDPSRLVLGMICGYQLLYVPAGDNLQLRTWSLSAFRALTSVLPHHGTFITEIASIEPNTHFTNTTELAAELKGKISRIVLYGFADGKEKTREIAIGNVGAVIHILTSSYLRGFLSEQRAWATKLRELAGMELEITDSVRLKLEIGLRCDFDEIVLIDDLGELRRNPAAALCAFSSKKD